MLLALDPGIRGCGCALFDDPDCTGEMRLVKAAYVKNPEKEGQRSRAKHAMASAVSDFCWPSKPEVAYELMVSRYQRSQQKGDQNDLITLADVAGRIVGRLGGWSTDYKPEEWKGQLTKEAAHERINERLSPEEKAVIVTAGHLTHNVLDAIGIGLHHLGRFKPKKVYPR